MRSIPELSDHELELRIDRTWRNHYRYVEEQNRRNLIKRYGSDEPGLDTYAVDLSLTVPVTVRARNAEEAEVLVIDEIYLMSDDRSIITFCDCPDIVVDDLELMDTSDE
jgi:hypothetical protein